MATATAEKEKTTKGQAQAGPVQRWARDRSDRVRRTYISLRRAAEPTTFLKRKRAVRDVPGPAGADIDPAEGYRILPAGTIPEAEEVTRAARSLVDLDRIDELEFPNKPYMHTGLLDTSNLDMDSAFLRFALSDAVVGAVSRYLGMVPVLRQAAVWCSRYHPSVPKGSQLYHCDGAEISQMKVFVNCSDVKPGDGPLTIVNATDSARARREMDYTFDQKVSDEAVYDLVGSDKAVPIVGPPGTVAMVDTSRCFHFGSRLTPESDPRLLAIFQYVTPISFASQGKTGGAASAFGDLTPEPGDTVTSLLLGRD